MAVGEGGEAGGEGVCEECGTFIGAFIGDVYGARIMGGREIGARLGATRVFLIDCSPIPPLIPPPALRPPSPRDEQEDGHADGTGASILLLEAAGLQRNTSAIEIA
jgi:hypothetical protein